MSIKKWKKSIVRELNRDTITKLFQDEIAGIMIPNFASAEECHTLVQEANKMGLHPYREVSPRIDRIGITVFEYDKIDKRAYFQQVPKAKRIQHSLTRASFDPLKRMVNLVQGCTNHKVSVAHEKGLGSYYAGLVRRIEKGTLYHIDYAPVEQPGWAVSTVTNQLSWNLYLEFNDMDGSEGQTTIYNRQWQPEDEQYKIENSYGYPKQLLEGVESVKFKPAVGTVVIFNTRNYHKVEPLTRGSRVAFASAIGLFPNKDIMFWS